MDSPTAGARSRRVQFRLVWTTLSQMIRRPPEGSVPLDHPVPVPQLAVHQALDHGLGGAPIFIASHDRVASRSGQPPASEQGAVAKQTGLPGENVEALTLLDGIAVSRPGGSWRNRLPLPPRRAPGVHPRVRGVVACRNRSEARPEWSSRDAPD